MLISKLLEQFLLIYVLEKVVFIQLKAFRFQIYLSRVSELYMAKKQPIVSFYFLSYAFLHRI